MKFSIKKQLIAAFSGLIILILASIFLINSSFLEQYYVSHKESEMAGMYQIVFRALEEGNIENAEVQNTILRRSERSNVSMLVMRITEDQSVEPLLFTEQEGRGSLPTKMFGYSIGRFDGNILKRTDDYIICKSRNPVSRSDYLDMYGTIGEDVMFVMQSPLESIRDSAALANRFLLYIGIIMLVLGSLFGWFFAHKITDPILELAALSKRMANLDFEARYTSGGQNELGVLGESFNTMSSQLESTISELKAANNRLQKDIEQKEKMENMRNEFLGNVSHELKTPIALIQGYAEGLKEGISEDAESRAFYCEVIMDEANKMNQMVKNLLTLNQLEFGSQELQFERFDLVRMIRGVVSSCEILLKQAGVSVELAAEEAVYVWADEFKTEQVLRNYLTNAIHHVNDEKQIEICVIPKEHTVRVTVFNSGDPIPEEDIGKIWDKFYKVDKAHTREYGGNGIGLSIVKAIMESFRQSYGVQNFANGVQFWFELDTETISGKK